ncbi:gfo/Idh/MocA family oxidoreductase [Paenibacillus sp. HJL G12]|uniref:Gfo/Idh/MocA family oxidoreductase n=1 Tax=Paenibacillus dendrobii TaxID=2691084 RepID=A0A7X3LKV5_9BACL|nr:Gfo/Idh/MocA family oxidoreductase [Paenibacillus dendrobii]MWV46988.1 gfo/Idh/MocA family oxidoreductase [Paenibacillus dendrobii]
MKVAVIGCGGMGTIHADRYASMPGITLTGVCDIDVQAAEKLAEKTGATHFSSMEDLIREARPDVVSIAVPTYMHVPLIKQAAEEKVHIICEKPIALSPAEAAEAIDFCESRGVRLFVGQVVRFFPQYQQLAEQIQHAGSSSAGIYHASRAGSHPGLVRDWYHDRQKSGGVIVDLMIHDIDYVLGAFGEIEEVFAFHRVQGGIDYASATFRCTNGTIAQLEGFWGYPGPFTTTFEFAGKDGIIRYDSNDAQSVRVRRTADLEQDGGFVETPQSELVHDPYYRELFHFLECIRSGMEPAVTAADALNALKWACAAEESAQSGLPVRLEKEAAKS